MENKQIVLTMTAAQVNIVLAHLSNGAFKDVHDLINLITTQGNQQVAAPTPEAPLVKDEALPKVEETTQVVTEQTEGTVQ